VACGPTDENPAAQQNRKPLGLTFIANEGVMIESGSVKILIDALFDRPNPAYEAPSDKVLRKLEQGRAPFDKVDLALITHNHPDHMSFGCVDRFMQHNRKTVLIMPRDIVEELKTSSTDWGKIRKRVKGVDIEVNSAKDLMFKTIKLRVYRTLHSGDRESPWNFMYLLSFNGWKVFHEGDSDGKMETYRQLGFQDLEIDLALVHFWFPLHPVGSEFLQKVAKPHHIALIHLPLELYEDAPTKIDLVKQYYTDIFLLKESMETRVFR
jgi:L-ascorbate metabolism protein UlaG (beta-lactamase superfamily)